MVFSSVVFIFYFLPVFLACYLTLPFKHAVLLFFSLCFYAYGEVLYTYVMLGSIVLNWAFGILIGTAEGRSRQLALACGVAANLAGLCYFKYLGFFTTSRPRSCRRSCRARGLTCTFRSAFRFSRSTPSPT